MPTDENPLTLKTPTSPSPDLPSNFSLVRAVESELARRELARRHFLDFVLYTFPGYELNWHHRFIAQFLELLVSGVIDRAMIFAPPRHGKSELVSRRLPPFLLGQNPELELLSASHNADLAVEMSLDVQRIIASQEYRALFPTVKLVDTSLPEERRPGDVQSAKRFSIIGHDGVYRAAGVGTGITGRGADFAIIDDPIKDRAEADSEAIRRSIYNWYTSTLYTRQEKGARILVTSTRWHEDDLAGKILRQAKESEEAERWFVLWLPAIMEAEPPHELRTNPRVTLISGDERKPGEALWPNKYDERRLAATKATVGARDWAALYQGRPAPDEGTILKAKYLLPFEIDAESREIVTAEKQRLRIDDCLRFNIVDLATSEKKSAAYTAIASFYAHLGSRKLFLVDMLRERLTGGEHDRAIEGQRLKHRAAYSLVEKVAFQLELVQAMKKRRRAVRELQDYGSDKIARAYAASAVLERFEVCIPAWAPWLEVFRSEILNFPFVTFKDQVDVFVYGILHFDSIPGNLAPASANEEDSTRAEGDRLLDQVRPARRRQGR